MSHRLKFDDLCPNSCYYGHFVFVVIPSEWNGLSTFSALHRLTYHCLTCEQRIERNEHVTAKIEGPIIDGVQKVMPHSNTSEAENNEVSLNV